MSTILWSWKKCLSISVYTVCMIYDNVIWFTHTHTHTLCNCCKTRRWMIHCFLPVAQGATVNQDRLNFTFYWWLRESAWSWEDVQYHCVYEGLEWQDKQRQNRKAARRSLTEEWKDDRGRGPAEEWRRKKERSKEMEQSINGFYCVCPQRQPLLISAQPLRLSAERRLSPAFPR